LFALSFWTAHPTSAQEIGTRPAASEFPTLYQRWQQARDPEQKIALGEELLAAEAALAAWPLQQARGSVMAKARFELGSAYVTRPTGVRADSLEKGIAHLEAAISTWTREKDPQSWAQAHNNLGIAYWGRIRGEGADNQEKAIAHFEAALTLLTRASAPEQWAQLQNNLAVVYIARARGDLSANQEKAIECLEAALTVFTREASPHLWAQAQNNLANAYRGRTRGAPGDNQSKAIVHFEAALSVLTRQAFPLEWAMAQSNLALVYLDRAQGDHAGNQEEAIARVEAALTVFTREAFPQQWAMTQRNAGNAYADRIRGSRSGNRSKAIAAYEAALTVFTRDAYPRDHLITARLLGREFSEAGDWRKAGRSYNSAREAFLLLFGQGLEVDDARTLVADAGPMFAEAAFAAVERGESEAALELADEGRARLLAAAMKLQSLDLPAAGRQRLDELRAAIRAEHRVVDAAVGTDRAVALEKLIVLRQELLDLVKIAGNSSGGSALVQARALTAPGGVIAMPIVTGLGAKILVATTAVDGKALAVVDLPELTMIRLSQMLVGQDVEPIGGWIGAYFINYLDGAEQNRRWPEWTAAIDGLGPELWRLFASKLDAALKAQGIKPGARLMWLPSGWLGILPLGLAQDPASKRRLADGYEIVYASSLESLTAAHLSAASAAPPSLAAIINPTGDLPGTEKEGAVVASQFASGATTLLERESATPEAVLAALKGRTHWHFASHGTFSWQNVRQSGLVMHGGVLLSVGRLQESSDLGHPRLVVLSACETGLHDITHSPDEFFGLPSTFTALGAAGVISTLWPVSDEATALLIAKFYELHIGAGLAPPTALSKAQAWLRNATSDDLDAYAKSATARGRLESRHLAEIEAALSLEGMKRSRNSALFEWLVGNQQAGGTEASIEPNRLAHPYAHPYFWAGFIYTGL
jgi:CHAT domain-containing protein/tetratricopeptide (TPR) repeat protein